MEKQGPPAELIEIAKLMSNYTLDTYNTHVYVECQLCDSWAQRFYDGTLLDEVFIAAMSHRDKVHQVH